MKQTDLFTKFLLRLTVMLELAIFCIVLASCENFLNGEQTKNEILDAIAYNNAPSCTIILDDSDVAGSFLSGSEKNCKVGYTIDVQFSVKSKDYVYMGMKAVSKSNPAVSRSEYVKFTDLSTEEEKQAGNYKVQIKLQKKCDDIMIKPVCLLIPQVTQVSPLNDNTTYPQDTSIKVAFNKPVNLSDFADENGFLKNISITSGETNLLDTTTEDGPHYKAPYLENEGKTLVIPIVKGNYLFKNSSATTMKIDVTVNLLGLKDAVENENVEFVQNEYSFTFKVNSQKDNVAPQLKTLRIARTQEDAENGTNLIAMDEFTHYADSSKYNDDSTVVAQNIQNHHVNKVWIYFEANDLDSGVDALEIKEQLIRKTTGNEIQGIIYNRDNQGAKKNSYCKNQTGNNEFSDCIEYEFNSDDDGVVKLEFVLKDRAENGTNGQAVDLIKDTVCELPLDIYNSTRFVEDYEDEYPFEVWLTIVSGSYTYITDIAGNEYKDYYPSQDNLEEKGSVEIIGCYYGYDENNLEYIDLQQTDYTFRQANTTYIQKTVLFNADPYKNVIVQGVIRDTAGNIKRIGKVIPSAMDVLYADLSDTNSVKLFVNNIDHKQFLLNRRYQEQLDSQKSSYTHIYTGSSDFYKGSLVSENIAKLFGNKPKDGYYSFTAVWYSEFPNKPMQFTSYRGKPVIIKKEGDTYSLVNTGNEIISVSQSDVPVIEVRADPPAVNSGLRQIHVTYKNLVPEPKLKYFIHYKAKAPGTCYGYSAALDFYIPTEYCSYDFTAVVMNENGQTCESLEPVTIDLSADNIPPVVSRTPPQLAHPLNQLLFNSLAPAFSTLTIKIEDKSLKNDSQTATIKYVFSDTNEEIIDWSQDSRVHETKLIELEDTASTNVWGFDVVSYEQKYAYNCYVLVNDLCGNFTEAQFVVQGNKEANLGLKYENSSFSVSHSYLTIEKSFINTQNKWQQCEDTGNNLNFSSTEKDSFIKLHIWKSYCTGGGGYKESFFDYVYFYPQYYILSGTGTPVVCELKNVSQGLFGYDISADQPCFVHTMYCPLNLGDHAQDWLNSGYETGLVMKNKSFTYSYDNASEVPDGYYYTTVVHFADGSTFMIPVKQKN